MSPLKRLQVEQSEKRQKLNALLAENELNEEQRAEMEALTKRLQEIEPELRAALVAEGEETREETTSDDGETVEIRRLESRIELRGYMGAALSGRELDGAESEYHAAIRAEPGVVPWAAIAPRVEERADAATTGPTTHGAQQDTILGRVFARAAATALGVRFVSVPTGDAVYPVLTGGASPSMVAAAGAKDAEAATFAAHSLSPVRLTGAYLFAVEDAAKTVGFEEALRADLSMAISDAIDAQVLTGNGTAPNVNGFHNELPAASAAGSAAETFSGYAKALAGGIDGKHADSMGEIACVVGEETVIHAEGVFTSNGEESAASYLMRRCRAFRACANSPAVSSNVQEGVIYRAGGGGDAVAPMWGAGPRLIRDEFSGASKGQVRLTYIQLWNFKVIREAAYKLFKFRHAA